MEFTNLFYTNTICYFINNKIVISCIMQLKLIAHLFYRLATHAVRLDIGHWRKDFMNVSPRTHYTECTNKCT